MPTMSLGMRSGVHWMRENEPDVAEAIVVAAVVFAEEHVPARQQRGHQRRVQGLLAHDPALENRVDAFQKLVGALHVFGGDVARCHSGCHTVPSPSGICVRCTLTL